MANTSPWAQIQQDAAPPPAMAPISLPDSGQMPQVFAPTPTVKLAPQPPTPQQQLINQDQQRLEKVRWNQENPWGKPENHPGKLGKVAHVFSTLGNIAGDIFAPAAMANIPGTQAHMQAEENGLTHRLNTEIGDESQNEYRGAEQAHTQEETKDEALNQPLKERLEGAQADEAEQKAQAGPDLAQAYAHAVNQAIKNGSDPGQDPVVQHLTDAIKNIQKQGAPGTKVIQREVGNKPHNELVDERTGADIRDLGETGEKPPTVNVNAGEASLDREASRLAKPYEKGVSDANAQLDKIADARTMINGSAEAQALGVPKVLTALVSGQGSGVRITQPELNAIAKARGLAGDVEGTLRSWSGAGKLTPVQQKQLTGILDDVQERIRQKQQIHNDALDQINGAPTREAVIQADKQARQKLNDLEKHGAEPTRPAKVPEGYIFNENGPKGKGWYAPTAK